MGSVRIPDVVNEPNHHYAKGSAQRKGLQEAYERMRSRGPVDVPMVINGFEIRNENKSKQQNPADHASTVATYSNATAEDVANAIRTALGARVEWQNMPFEERAAIFLKAADLIAGKYRYELMAATMLGQGKNAWQAEIDAAAELVDFLRFNVKFAEELYAQQPAHNSPGVWNRLEYRPLEGFVYAVSPFNFTAIAGNLPCAPALMGNVVVWKPSDSAIASNWLLYQILLEAGLPHGVIQFVPGPPELVTKIALDNRKFAALHYTGSTAVFRKLYREIGVGIGQSRYVGYPRIVGETGGKNYHLIHDSAAVDNAAVQTVRGAFEYQGQKCSATSRCYVSAAVWPEFKKRLVAETKALTQGPPDDFSHFVGPVIHEASFDKLAAVIDAAKEDKELELLAGGTYDKSKGYYITPTIYLTTNARHPLLTTELFGPILVVYVLPAPEGRGPNVSAWCNLISSSTDYALTGSVFARDRVAVRELSERLRESAGNFYINCKSTGAVVGQQPFGGARASGTNDKAGSMGLLSRFVSVRSMKEEFVEVDAVPYPSNEV